MGWQKLAHMFHSGLMGSALGPRGNDGASLARPAEAASCIAGRTIMKNVMNLAVVNFTCDWGDKEKNLERILGYCEAAGKRGMDLVVFPECALTGYDTDLDHVRPEKMHVRLAETIPGPATERVAELTKRYGMHVVFGMPELAEGTVYNSAAIVTPEGKASSYRKLHLPFDEATWAEIEDEPRLFETPWGPVGVTIRYDTYCFPGLNRYYRAKGCRLVLNVTACPDAPCTADSARLAIPAYAFIDYMFIASANLCRADLRSRFIGGSSVVGPAYTGGDVETYIGTMFGEPGSDVPGMKCGTIGLSLCDRFVQIPLFRKDAEGKSDFRPELYAKLYQELAKD